MATTTQPKKTTKVVRIDDDVDRFILSRMRPQESYNEAFRRVLGLDKDGRREESRRDRRRAS